MNIVIINGPNINLLGKRNPDVYGRACYSDLIKYIKNYCKSLSTKVNLEIKLTNHEGDIIDYLQNSDKQYTGIVLNAAAYSHYSIAIRDAIEAISTPVVEVHLTDIKNREDFRKISVIEDVCIANFSGFGFDSYIKAIDYLVKTNCKK